MWKCFVEIFRLTFNFSSISPAVTNWMTTSSHSQYGVCRANVAAYILREIWVSRCRATFDGTPMHARSICLKILSRVQLINLIHVPKRRSTPYQENIRDHGDYLCSITTENGSLV